MFSIFFAAAAAAAAAAVGVGVGVVVVVVVVVVNNYGRWSDFVTDSKYIFQTYFTCIWF